MCILDKNRSKEQLNSEVVSIVPYDNTRVQNLNLQNTNEVLAVRSNRLNVIRMQGRENPNNPYSENYPNSSNNINNSNNFNKSNNSNNSNIENQILTVIIEEKSHELNPVEVDSIQEIEGKVTENKQDSESQSKRGKYKDKISRFEQEIMKSIERNKNQKEQNSSIQIEDFEEL